jgi:AcrR family transcriptional regulator
MTERPVNIEWLRYKMPKIVDKQRKRSEIARIAIETFSKKGFENTTIQEIADAAKIGKGTIYEYFKTKEDIIAQVTIEFFSEMEKSMGAAFFKTVNSREKLQRMIQETMKITEEMEHLLSIYLEIWLIFLRGHGYSETIKMFDEFLMNMRSSIVQIIEEGKKTGDFRKNVDSESTAISLFAALDGIAVHYMLSKPKFDLEKITREFMDIFLSGLKK